MRIGIIAPPWIPIPPTAYGGIESFIDTLARALHDAGHDVVLAASGDSTSQVPRLPGFEPSDPAMMGVTAHELRHLLRAFDGLDDVDVIVDNTLAGPVLARSATNIPVVTVAHGPLIPLEQELYLAGLPEVTFVAISRNQASLAGPVPIARVIHHGIRVEDVPVGPGGDAACFVGRMHPSKGVPEAIEAAAIAGIPLRIAAKMQEPAEEEYFDEVVRPLLGTNAEYVGELDTDEKYDLMGHSCALLNPIQWDEPFGLVMIEAMATGTPVVATPGVRSARSSRRAAPDSSARNPRTWDSCSIALVRSTVVRAGSPRRPASAHGGWRMSTSPSSRTCCGSPPRVRAGAARPAAING